jgi:hypothetical protein
MTEWSAYVSFWSFCTVAVICWAAPRIIRASFEGMCDHAGHWEKLWEGKYQVDGETVGPGWQYRCDRCGANRVYK